MDLKPHYRTILAEIEKDNIKIDGEIKRVTEKLKQQKAMNNSLAKKASDSLAELEGTVAPKKRRIAKAK
jgi:phage gp16-like protein